MECCVAGCRDNTRRDVALRTVRFRFTVEAAGVAGMFVPLDSIWLEDAARLTGERQECSEFSVSVSLTGRVNLAGATILWMPRLGSEEARRYSTDRTRFSNIEPAAERYP